MKNLFILSIIVLALLFVNTANGHWGHGVYGPYGNYGNYGFVPAYPHLYPHTLAPGGTWYNPHYIAPRPQPPVKPDGIYIRQLRPLRPYLRHIYIPFPQQKPDDFVDPNAKPRHKKKNHKKNNHKK